jgi:prepilin-type N-terminal cleavage/methylation domain-containing protein
MATKFRKAFSLIEVLMSLVVLATLSIIIVNLASRILLKAGIFHNKLVRIVPMANSLNSISLINDLKNEIERKEFGPNTKIVLRAQNLENKDQFFDFKGIQKVTAEATWDDFKEDLVRWIFIYQKNDQAKNSVGKNIDGKNDDQEQKKNISKDA